MPADYVFVGPSLPRAQVTRLLPHATILPPVEHGDLLRLPAAPGDRVFLVDGLFLQTAPVRHREILLLLDQGVVVAGSSSMGALRGAELWPFGMRGVGEVFRLYRDGEVTGDDEVAVVHGSADDGYRAFSEPMVNIRVALRTAAAQGVITGPEAAALTDLAAAMPFRDRSYRALDRIGRDRIDPGPLDRFIPWAERHAVDLKAADARLMLGQAAHGAAHLRPHDADDAPIRNVHTEHLDRWRVRQRGARFGDRFVADVEVVAALMLTHPGFVAEHRQRVLAELAGTAPDDPTAPDRALALAESRGLAPIDRAAGATHPWLLDAEIAGPHSPSDGEAALRALVRAFGAASHHSLTLKLIPPALRAEPVWAAARAFVAAAGAINDTLPRTDPHRPARRMRFRDPVVDQVFAELWGCDPAHLPAAVWDRGFGDLTGFRLAAEPLVGYLRTTGAPAYPRTPDPVEAPGRLEDDRLGHTPR
jgi:hypothetical protein